VNLLTFFKWREHRSQPEAVRSCLKNIQLVKGDELMRFHNDVLSALFSISCDTQAGQNLDLFFEALVYVLKFPKEKNFEQFLPLIESYIEETFCAPLAHR